MSFSTCYSSSAVALAVSLVACAGGRIAAAGAAPPSGTKTRLALFPPENVSGSPAPMAPFRRALGEALRARGLTLVDDERLEQFLTKHRLRYAGGLGRDAATAAGQELGVDAVLITSLELYSPSSPPKLALMMRVVSASDPPSILWTDGIRVSGDDEPGWLGLGVVGSFGDLEKNALEVLTGRLAAFLDGKGPRATVCPPERRFRPRASYLSPAFEQHRPYTVAVLPFVNETERRGAGEVVALEFLGQLQASETFAVLEPGIVREVLLRHRIIMEDGVSLDTARAMLETLDADLILTGSVFDCEESAGPSAVPNVSFTALLLQRTTDQLVWQSTSFNHGDDGVFFFGWGRVSTASALACRMASAVADQILQ